MKLSYPIAQLTTRGMLLVILAVAWIMGILIDSTLQLPPRPCLLLSGLILLFLITFWQKQRYRLLFLLLLCISLGSWRYSRELPQFDLQRELPQFDLPSVQRFIGPTSSLGIRGVVSDEPKLQTRTRLLMIKVNAVQISGNSQWENAAGNIEVITLFNGSSAEDPYGANYGDSVELHGKLLPPTTTSSRDAVASMSFPRVHVSANSGNVLIASIYHLRNQLATLIEQALPQPEAALLIAIFLGLRTPALRPLAFAFNVTGTAHLIVPSGFKVTILSGLVARPIQHLLQKTSASFPPGSLHKSWRDWIKIILVLLSIALYTMLSGAGPAALRAGTMGGLLVIAPILGRNYNVYTALAGTATFMSFINPFILWDVGFQLSFLGTLGIVLLTPYLQKLLQPIARLPAGSLVIEMTAVTLAAQLATLPIFAVAFQQVSLIAPLANILTVPLLGPVIVFGLGIGITGFVFHPVSLLWGWIAWPILWYMQTIIKQCSLLPGAFFHVDNFPTPIAWLYYAFLTLATSFLFYHYPLSPTKQHPSLLSQLNRKHLYAGGIVFVIVMIGITIIPPLSTTSNTVSFFGSDATIANEQPMGEAIFVHTPDGKTLLIDGGNSTVSLSQLLDSQLLPWHHSLDMVILTSPQQDTMTGLQDVLTRYNIGFVFDAGMAHPTTSYARWRRIINERKLQYTPVAQGTTITLGTTTQLQVLWPQDRLHTGSNEIRDNGLILRLVMPGLRLLLLGSSIESNYALSGLLASVEGDILKSDIVQVLGEMNTPVPSVFTNVLQQAQPSLVVITSPMQRKSSQSTNNTRSTLSSALAPVPQVQQTAKAGTLELHSDGKGWAMSG